MKRLYEVELSASLYVYAESADDAEAFAQERSWRIRLDASTAQIPRPSFVDEDARPFVRDVAELYDAPLCKSLYVKRASGPLGRSAACTECGCVAGWHMVDCEVGK